jgi:hypothetical protein
VGLVKGVAAPGMEGSARLSAAPSTSKLDSNYRLKYVLFVLIDTYIARNTKQKQSNIYSIIVSFFALKKLTCIDLSTGFLPIATPICGSQLLSLSLSSHLTQPP